MNITIEQYLNKHDAEIVRKEIKRMVRVAGDNINHLNVIAVNGSKKPHIVGAERLRGYYTKSGEAIAHPSAYMKRGFSNMVYYSEPRYIAVGIKWLNRFAGAEAIRRGVLF
ncbi:MAG: hypothetical protein WC055_00140 [Melioribacteraceae bacterium]